MFPNSSRNLTRADTFYHRHWKPLLRRASLPDLRFHDLRHTCATLLLLTKGVHPKTVSEVLGHSSVSITLDTYSHVSPGLGEVAARAMEDVLSRRFRLKRRIFTSHVMTNMNGIAGATINSVFPKPHLSRLVQNGRSRSTSRD
jgi:hypothetical protein